MQNNKDKNDNGVFCVMPWTHLALATSGNVRPCSWQSDDLKVNGEKYHATKHNILEHSTIEPIKTLKKNMLAGKKSSYCQRCYDQERFTGNSKRTVNTFTNQYDSALKILNGEDVSITRLELRFGNMCNLGCISCSPFSSNYFIREIDKKNPDLDKFDTFFRREYLKHKDVPMDWYKDKALWKKIEMYLSNIEYIYLAGGEPTIIPENWKFLERAVELDCAKNISLGISTNLTNVQDKHIEIYNKFKNTLIYCSIDGYGDVNDYLRYPSKWSAISSNLEKMLKKCNDNVEFKIIPVLSLFSIWSIEKLYNYINELKIKTNKNIEIVTHTLLRDPAYMSLVNMPTEAKNSALQIVDRLEVKYGKTQPRISRLRDYIFNSIGKENLELFYSGKNYVEQFDSMRNNSWKKAIPELIKYWKEYE